MKDHDKNKGRKGERNLIEKLLFSAERAGEDVDFRKPTYTNEPDDGLDIEMKAPHNFGEKLEAIVNNDDVPPSSTTNIDIRIDHKNYQDKIGKPIVAKFIDDCEKNPNDSEHWLTGGKGLTAPAQKELKKSEHVTRYFSNDDLNKIEQYFENEAENMIDNDEE